ncbi:MAG: hypothetical protein KGJ51_05765 [Acidobacteriota bacterium]|nr:hypothetical protein [Acidobacteriota bacterium]MDE3162297.1 hypothetical protein [Acidobacteriota bacterium]
MKRAILMALGGLMLVAGCNTKPDNSAGIPTEPKWKDPAYRLAFDAKAPKPNPVGITLPGVTFTANPDALERRATLVVRFDASGIKTDKLIVNQIILAPFDISGASGKLSDATLDIADQGLARLTGAYCMKGKVKVSIALARSSLNPGAEDAEIDDKRLSDWLPTEVVITKPHTGCK